MFVLLCGSVPGMRHSLSLFCGPHLQLSECLEQQATPDSIYFSTGGASPDQDLVVARMKDPGDIIPDPNDVVAWALVCSCMANTFLAALSCSLPCAAFDLSV